ncbi:hypothetical protein SNE40_002273 [Patella caerulea]|uniref:Integrase p58-like C-terminal domain-containing protein n=1 Tax=Patella caerulea TaxID=87958 RepID=A0AAN8K7I4_PATCE
MMLGRSVKIPIDLVFGGLTPRGEQEFNDDYTYKLVQRMEEVHEFARDKMQAATRHMKRMYDATAGGQSFAQGDAVWIRNNSKKRGLCRKLLPKWCGPFVIIEKPSDLLYRVKDRPNSPSKVVHHDKMRRYKGINQPVWVAKGEIGAQVRPPKIDNFEI